MIARWRVGGQWTFKGDTLPPEKLQFLSFEALNMISVWSTVEKQSLYPLTQSLSFTPYSIPVELMFPKQTPGVRVSQY